MSVTGLVSDHDSLYMKSNHHRRKDSGELDVFEAAQYFSGHMDQSSILDDAITLSQFHHQKTTMNMMISDERKFAWRGRNRISLDMPLTRNQNPSQSPQIEKQIITDKISYKQPRSPGGKLASFFNSLFNQTSSNNKKSSMKDIEDQESKSSGGGRKRRSSISHLQSFSKTSTTTITTTTTTTTSDHHHRKSSVLYSSSLSIGYRTPPPPPPPPRLRYTPTNICKDLSKCSGSKVSSISNLQDDYYEKFKFIDGFSEKTRKFSSSSTSDEKKDNQRRVVGHQVHDQMDDDGGESDSSSDLFELQNYDLGDVNYSSDLPVYETTQVDSIKISNDSF